MQTSKTRFVHGDRGKILRFRRNRIFRKVLVPAQPGEMGWAPFQENFILLAEQADISSGILSCLLFAKQRKQTDRTADDTPSLILVVNVLQISREGNYYK